MGIDQRRVIKLYIRPQKGPICEIELDLLEMETNALAFPAGRQDEARIQDVMDQIRKKFPRLDVENQRGAIARIMSRFQHAYYFDGMVLEMRGQIDEKSAFADSSPADAVRQMVQEVQKTRQQYGELQNKYNMVKVRLEATREENKRFAEQYQTVTAEAERLRFQIAEGEDRLRRASSQLKQLREQINEVEQRESELQTQLELAQAQMQNELTQARQHVEQVQKQYQDELSRLRREEKSATAANKSLEETLAKRDAEIKELHERIDHLLEGTPDANETMPYEDPYGDL